MLIASPQPRDINNNVNQFFVIDFGCTPSEPSPLKLFTITQTAQCALPML